MRMGAAVHGKGSEKFSTAFYMSCAQARLGRVCPTPIRPIRLATGVSTSGYSRAFWAASCKLSMKSMQTLAQEFRHLMVFLLRS